MRKRILAGMMSIMLLFQACPVYGLAEEKSEEQQIEVEEQEEETESESEEEETEVEEQEEETESESEEEETEVEEQEEETESESNEEETESESDVEESTEQEEETTEEEITTELPTEVTTEEEISELFSQDISTESVELTESLDLNANSTGISGPGYEWKYDAETKSGTLTLDNLDMELVSGSKGYVMFMPVDTTVILKGENSIKNSAYYEPGNYHTTAVLYCKGNITFKGNGSLTLNSDTSLKSCISAKDLTINSVHISTQNNADFRFLSGVDVHDIVVKKGTLSSSVSYSGNEYCYGRAIAAASINLESGKIIAEAPMEKNHEDSDFAGIELSGSYGDEDSIQSDGTISIKGMDGLIISGKKFTQTGGQLDIEAKDGIDIWNDGELEQCGGTITVNATDSAISMEGNKSVLAQKGGTLHVNSDKYGIGLFAGTFSQTGGTIRTRGGYAALYLCCGLNVTDKLAVTGGKADETFEDVISIPAGDVKEPVHLVGDDVVIEPYSQVSWNYLVDKTILYTNDDDNRESTVKVNYTTATPKFVSSDKTVATIEATPSDKYVAKITAVGTGTTTITITVGRESKSFDVTVARKRYVTGIQLNQSEITLAMGNTDNILSVSVLPEDEQEEEIQEFRFASSDTDIIQVQKLENDGTKVRLLPQKMGTAAVTVSAIINDKEYSDRCEVTVLGVFTQEEKDELIKDAGADIVLLNKYSARPRLKDAVWLASAWSWIDGTEVLTADNDAPIQKFAARYTREGYEPFTALIEVPITNITGVTIQGASTLASGKSSTFKVAFKCTGYQVTSELDYKFDYSWKLTDAKNYGTLQNSTKKSVTLTEGNVTKNTTQTLSLVMKLRANGKTFKATHKVNAIVKPYIDNVTIRKAETQDSTAIDVVDQLETQDLLQVNWSDYKKKEKDTITLNAAASTEGVSTETTFKWTSSDNSVLSVTKTRSYGKEAVVTINKPGTATLTAIVQDNGKAAKSIVVKINDYRPYLKNNKVTINQFSTAGIALPVAAPTGSTITGITIQEQNKKKEWVTSEHFSLNNKSWVLKTVNADAARKVTYKTRLCVTYKVGGETQEPVYLNDFSVTVDVIAPKATVKLVSKANLFYANTTGTYKLTTTAEINSITATTSTKKGFAYQKDYDPETGLLSFKAVGLTKTSLADFTAKNSALRQVKLKITFKGYDKPQELTVNIETENKKPSLKYNDVVQMKNDSDHDGNRKVKTSVYDVGVKAVYDISTLNNIKVESKTSGIEITPDQANNAMSVEYTGNKQSITYKTELSSSDWTQSVTVSGKISVNDIQTLALEQNSITLNTAHCISKNGCNEIGVSVKNNDSRISSITYSAVGRDNNLTDNGYLCLKYDAKNQKILTGLNEGFRGEDGSKEYVKAGTYKFKIAGKDENGDTLKETVLSIVLTDKAPALTLSAKGDIDLLQRKTTAKIYTAKLTNVTAKPEKVFLSGSGASYFNASVNKDGAVVIRANTGASMSTKINYAVNVKIKLDNNAYVSQAVTIKPICKVPAIKADVSRGTLYKNSNEELKAVLSLDSDLYSIDKIEQVMDQNSSCFICSADETDASSKTVIFSLADDGNRIKPGNYTVSYNLYLKDRPYNVKPITMKMIITVK